ncbi:signal peptide peptidase SppA [Ascidiimonas sp. W6]|uniref:signal peptide peptidase SppA n=1 Tax=Ascidiimonas meishanensis TaxID=3128903 RepID=UPI0030ED277D
MNFLRNVLSTIIGVFLAMMIIFLFFLFFIAIASSGGKTKVPVKKHSVIELRFDEPIQDFGGTYSFKEFDYSYVNYNGLNHIVNAIKTAKSDDKIDGISIHTGMIIAGMGQLKAIRDALKDFKESGKFVYAYADFYPQKDYYLASVADSVYLNPVGNINFRGLAAELLFYKDFQEKSGLKMEVVRHGKFKSAVEPYLENEMSDANRLQISDLLHSIWDQMLKDIGESRKLSVAQLNSVADELGGNNIEKALENKLIDGVIYDDQYRERIAAAAGVDSIDDFKYIKMERYAEYAHKKKKVTSEKPKIAVVFAQGEIIYGEGTDTSIGQGIMMKALKEAREDESIKAVVLRVDSPGGSALASEIIWREVEITRAVKPVVVSMGDLAASGGYYIAMGGQKIFAEPTTITGSIGVFGLLPNMQELAGRIGINAEQVGTNKQASGYSVFEPLSEEVYHEIEEGIEEIYATFLKRVADNRGLTVAQVDSIAQGRVWSGIEAKEIGLVDELGGLDEAIAAAAEIAEIEVYSMVSFPEYKTDLEEIFEQFSLLPGVKSRKAMIKEEIGAEAYELLQRIKELSQQKGIQARMPFEFKIR